MLYPALRPSIPALIELLNDEDDKTRANAAGNLQGLKVFTVRCHWQLGA
jgi:HEAT repeat protein